MVVTGFGGDRIMVVTGYGGDRHLLGDVWWLISQGHLSQVVTGNHTLRLFAILVLYSLFMSCIRRSYFEDAVLV